MAAPDLEAIHQRRMEVYRLRREGAAVVKIGTTLGVSQATVSKDMAWLRANGYKLGGTDLVVFEDASRRARTSNLCDPVRIAELRHQIVTKRLEGYVPRDIARTLGVALETVQRHLAAVFNGLAAQKAEQALQLELERLDRYLVALEPGISAGDPKSIAQAIRISDQRAKYQGLYAPTRVEATVITIDAIDAEIERLTEQLGQVIGEQPTVEGQVIDADRR